MKKYIFIDIDGTLTNSNKKVTENNIKAMSLSEEKGFEIVFCSGRNNDYLIDLAEKCNTSRYIISSNGSMIYDRKDKKILHQEKISSYVLEKLFNYCYKNYIAMAFNTEEKRYCNDYINYNDYYKESKAKRVKSIDDLKDKNITQICIGSYNYDEMLEVKDFLNKLDELEIVNISTTMKLKQKDNPNGFFYDVVTKGINKGVGITNFIKIMSLDKKDCVAIGDHVNDLAMFKAVGFKIAMGNAYEELKNKADYITKTNDEDGVKYALEYLEKEFL